MLDRIIDLLACPVCQQALQASTSGVHCSQGHSFDRARQGYLSLLQPQALTSTGDDPAMVDARAQFLDSGHYTPLRDELVRTVTDLQLPGGGVLDLGAGTGYYTAGVLDALPRQVGVALDTSKAALRRAARAHPRLGAVAADAWQPLPVRDAAICLSLNVFAPRNAAELARVAAPGGRLVVVTPGQAHLHELRHSLGLLDIQPEKNDRLRGTLGAYFTAEGSVVLTAPLELDRRAAATLAGMGPSARHTDSAALSAHLADLPEPLAVTAEFRVSVWAVRPDASGVGA